MDHTNIQLQSVITKLQRLDNDNLLQRVSDFLDGMLAASGDTKTDWWNELPDTVQQDYEEGIKEMEAGEETNADDFLKKYR
ncbi:MAG: hypothetical protein AB8B65_12405 [Kordia sp.]|uniref:hypothetical protein n=1 Tax=Kordia sp. TaxID=1965332 RepID=UPI00385F4DEF